MGLCLHQLVDIWGEPLYLNVLSDLNKEIGPICTDSRNLLKGSFFVPLGGKNFDGHDFVLQAFELGAQAAVVSRDRAQIVPKGFLHWIVEDTLEAYQELGLLYRNEFDIPVVAITGSTGKTTTRELIRSLVAIVGEVCSSHDNNNNDVGVPLTLTQLHSGHRTVLVEMGMRALGEIERLSCCTHPDIAVITNIGNAHVGLLGSRSNIASAKCEITAGLRPNGVVIIPAGDPLLEEMLIKKWTGRIVRVALELNPLCLTNSSCHNKNDVLPKPDVVGKLDSSNTSICIEGKVFKLPLEGIHNAQNFLLALAVARELNIEVDPSQQHHVELPTGRNGRIKLGEITLLDETYNASPESVKASLEFLSSQPGRHFAVLGSMLELGEQSVSFHREIVEDAIELGLEGLVVVSSGAEAKAMAKTGSSLGSFAVVERPEDAAQYLFDWLEAGDVLLLKASRDIKMERLIPLLKDFYS